MIKLTYKSKSRIKTTEKQAAPSAQPETEALVQTVMNASKVSLGAGASAPSGDSGPPPHQVIKLGIDVHLDRYVVVRQIDGGAPQPPQRFSPRQFLEWVKKQTALAQQVYSCYEAGPFGYRLHRKLKELGITNYVIRPRDWDEYGKKVKTDKRDAKAMVLSLDRYVSGNTEAFCVVRVPTEAEEQARSRSRQRESFAEGEATSGGPGTQPRPLLRCAFGGGLVDRRSLEGDGGAAHCAGVAGAAAPAHPGAGAGTQDLEPIAD
jgi:hypothetical protein